jgi:hypothetical protein
VSAGRAPIDAIYKHWISVARLPIPVERSSQEPTAHAWEEGAMGLMGRYIDGLPVEARDRLIQAQEWCLASVVEPDGSRCLVGHAEDWRALAVQPGDWRRWMDDETGGSGPDAPDRAAGELDAVCSPHFFAFRRARPADMPVYRARVSRWGLASEARIGARFDRLCARRGLATAIRIVKRRAAASVPIMTPDTTPRSSVPA